MKNISIKRISKIILRITFVIVIMVLGFYFYPEKKLPEHCMVDKISVEKSKREMHVYSKGRMLKTYSISLGYRPQGKKTFERDGKTPEGKYFIISKNGSSIAYKSLGISYPNLADIKLASQSGKRTGGNIMIHGMINGQGYWGKFHRYVDWTAGCIAVTNYEMDDLFKHVDIGCEIEIFD